MRNERAALGRLYRLGLILLFLSVLAPLAMWTQQRPIDPYEMIDAGELWRDRAIYWTAVITTVMGGLQLLPLIIDLKTWLRGDSGGSPDYERLEDEQSLIVNIGK